MHDSKLFDMAIASVVAAPIWGFVAGPIAYFYIITMASLVAGWSSRSLKRAGMRDVGEERGQLGRWGGGRPACPIELQPRPGAEPRPHPTQGRVPDDALPGGRCWP